MVELFTPRDLPGHPDRSDPDWHVTVLSTPHASQVERTDSPAVFAHCHLDTQRQCHTRIEQCRRLPGLSARTPWTGLRDGIVADAVRLTCFDT